MIPFSLISGPSDPGFDSVIVGGGNLANNLVAYFSFTITNKTTTNVGIKVPASRIGTNNITSPNSLGVADRSVKGDSPDILSGTGFPVGFNRNNWVTSSDANYLYVYTSNATQKSILTVGATYWFGFKVQSADELTTYLVTANTKTRYTSTGPTINFICGNGLGSNNKFMIVDVLDINA